jgi:hypothetical protein
MLPARTLIRYTILCLSLVILASCTTQRKIIREPIKEEGADYLFKKLKENELKFDWLTIKFSAEYRNKDQKNSFGGQMRIRKDSLIWLTMSPMMGIEVMRLMISQDSVKFINRLNNTYFVGDYDYLNKYLNTNIDYDILQSFLIGNDLSFYENGTFKAAIDKGVYKLSTAERRKLKKFVRNTEESLKIFIQNIWLDPTTFKIIQADVKEAKKDHIRMEANYKDFKLVGTQLFPHETEYTISAGNQIQVQATFSRITVDEPQQFPFKIPPSYHSIKP